MRFTLILFFSIFFSFSLCAQWMQSNGPEGVFAYDFEVINGQIWVATINGLYISADEGESWTKTDFMSANRSTRIRKIFRKGDEILMAVSEVNETENTIEFFLYRSTNLGASWTFTEAPSFSIYNLPIQLFRVDEYIFLQYLDKTYRSGDNGNTWETLTNTPNHWDIATNSEQIITTQLSSTNISYDLGETWTLLNSVGANFEPFMEESLIITYTVEDSIDVSEDLGITWNRVSAPTNFSMANTFKRGASGKLYLLNDQVFESEDNGLSWELTISSTSLNNKKVIDIRELPSGAFLFCNELGIFKTTESGDLWYPTHKDIIGTDVGWFAELPNGDVFVSSSSGYFSTPNGGDNWFLRRDEALQGGINAIVTKGDSTLIFRVDKAILLSMDNLNTTDSISSFPSTNNYTNYKYLNEKFYLLGTVPMVSEDLTNWSELVVTDPLTLEQPEIYDLSYTEDGALLSCAKNGKIYRSEDDGVSWQQVWEFTVIFPRQNYLHNVNGRIFSVNRDNWAYSLDNGLNWNIVAMEGIPRDAFNALPIEMVSIGEIMYTNFAGDGIFVSTNFGESWQRDNEGLSYLTPWSIFSTDDYLFQGTRVNGVWRSGAVSQSVGGFVYNDLNANGSFEANETPIENVLIESNPNGLFTRTNIDGLYTVYTEVSNDTIRAISPTPHAIVEPPYHLASASATDLDFGIHFIPDINDLSLTLTNVEPFRPGFDNTLIVTINNIGTTTISPIVKIALTNEISFLGASILPSQIDGDTLIWELAPMLPFDSEDISIDLNLSAATELGSLLEINGVGFPIQNDEAPENNNYALITEVVGSYDPNDKQVEPAGIFTPEQAENGDRLFYTVRFQNTGTFYAQNVRIVDTLSKKLDFSSIQLLSASHLVEWNVRGENILEFVFENIILPDSTSNEPESHGFVKFSILPSVELALGDVIDNFVDIYFDFNEPVRTNTAMTVFDINTLLIPIPEEHHELIIAPNPATNHCFISINDNTTGAGTVNIFDSKGSLIKEEYVQFGLTPILLKLDGMPQGLYTVKLALKEKVYVGKILTF